jgi:hypothetical protein
MARRYPIRAHLVARHWPQHIGLSRRVTMGIQCCKTIVK